MQDTLSPGYRFAHPGYNPLQTRRAFGGEIAELQAEAEQRIWMDCGLRCANRPNAPVTSLHPGF
jgi:hypothetical protein